MPMADPRGSTARFTALPSTRVPLREPRSHHLGLAVGYPDLGMEPRDVRVREHQVVGLVTADGHPVAFEAHRPDLVRGRGPRGHARVLAGQEPDLLAAQHDQIAAGKQTGSRPERLPVHGGAMARAQIGDRDPRRPGFDAGVTARHALAGDNDVVGLRAAQDHSRGPHLDPPPLEQQRARTLGPDRHPLTPRWVGRRRSGRGAA